MKFNPGDIVRLKTGGPDMVVESVYTSPLTPGVPPSLTCRWFPACFDGEHKAGWESESSRETFPNVSLVLVNADLEDTIADGRQRKAVKKRRDLADV